MDARRPITALLALSFALAACGGGGGDDTVTEEPTPTTAATGTPVADADPLEESSIALGAEVHYAGFLLAFEEVAVADGVATVTGTAENLGATSSTPPSNVTLATEAGELVVDPMASELPEVPGQSVGEVAYAFRIDAGTDLEGAALQIGGPDRARAIVPFGSDGDLVANLPVQVAVAGAAVAGETTFTFDGGELRFDVPDEHEPAEAGKAYLTLAFAVTNDSSFAGGYAFAGEDLRLETPSGITLAPEEFPIELLQPNATVTDLFARWVIDADEPGTYTFVGLRNVGFDTEAEGRLTFEVPAAG
jgi:hypothetical protein